MRFTPLILLLLAAGALAAPSARAPHGALIDRVLPLSHMERLDGSAKAPAATPARWRQAVHELTRAADTPPDWPAPRALQAAALAEADPHEVPLALLLARYDRLKDADTTEPAETVAAAALRATTYHGARVVFSLEPDHVLAFGASRPLRVRLDPDDGLGERPLDRLEVSYATTGPKTLRLSLDLEDGRTVHAAARLDVARLETPDPSETWTITASESWDGVAGTGLAYVYRSDLNPTLSDPVIVVEGFDMDNDMDWPVLYDLLAAEDLIEDLRADGYDAVVLDFTESTDPIQRNAFVLAELIARVNAAIDPGQTSVVIGASMGGLVSRYALTWLEHAGVDHRVRSFISFDSPQTGANIPLGLQHWLDFFRDESDDADHLLTRLDTAAAKQMLLYHHAEAPEGTAQPDPAFAEFRADLAALGDWPSTPRLVAVANGSGAAADQGYAPGDQLILYEYRSFLVDIDGNVWAVPDQSAGTIFDGMMNVIWPLPDTYQTVDVSGALPWDGAPGGWRASLAQMDTTAVEYGDIEALHNAHCFVPTVSALALDGVAPFHDVAGDTALLSRTPFDALYYPTENQEHIAITAENKAWFVAEIGRAPVDASTPAATHLALRAAPNPFNPATTLRFELPRTGAVRIAAYDLSGRRVRRLLDTPRLEAGPHVLRWDGRRDDGRALPSGIYVLRLDAAGMRTHRRVTLVK